MGEAIQSGWGLLDGEGRLLELSLPFSFAGERGTPSPVNQNPGSETPHGGTAPHLPKLPLRQRDSMAVYCRILETQDPAGTPTKDEHH